MGTDEKIIKINDPALGNGKIYNINYHRFSIFLIINYNVQQNHSPSAISAGNNIGFR
jgi:hypothetical protein